MASPSLAHNVAEYSVSEISSAIKRTMEDTFGYVRVRGEISGFKGQHSSGHCYFALKDEAAKLEAVVWKGTYGKLPVKPQEGLEVIAIGRITTYPGKSNYQIVIESIEPAGIGALMTLLEKRKNALEAEGLFRPERKKRLPFMPSVIGVITSPTGAVIRDILHRISDRFPVHVLVWPVAVQGEGAKEQVAAAIEGFNAMAPDGVIPKPDVLIVARGGGSLEDLWAFNEEIVVRAAANSTIPLISAVGHETDTTLIDFASDMRAPTPTAAAELAVPVREEWLYSVVQLGGRLSSYMLRLLQVKGERVSGLARGLPRPAQLLEYATQRLDDWSERLHSALPSLLLQKEKALHVAIASLRPQALAKDITGHWERLADWSERLQKAIPALFQQKEKNLHVAVAGLRPQVLAEEVRWCQERLDELFARAQQSYMRNLQYKEQRLQSLAQLVEQLNYTRVLERGFVLVRNEAGQIMRSVKQLSSGEKLQLQFHDGDKKVTAE